MASAVSVRKLSKRYGDFLALDRLELEVAEGEIFALLGPNGAGKTTLMRILTTQLPPSGGGASVLGRDVVSQAARVREMVSYVPQEMSVWTDISGYENLLIYSKIYGIAERGRREAIEDALGLMDLRGVEHHLVSTYSGGMIRKLELACAIMIKPRILFLDEPTIGLDPATRKTVWDRLTALNRENGTNVFFSTHYMDEAGLYAGRIGIINRGRLVKVASPEELLHSIANDRIEMELDDIPDDALVAAVRKAKSVSSAYAEGDRLVVSVRGDTPVDDMLDILAANKVRIRHISTIEPTIDEAFLKYVGTSEEPMGKASQVREVKEARKRIVGG